MFEVIQTQWGDLFLEDDLDFYVVYPSDDFKRCVLYDFASDNEDLMEAVGYNHSDGDPILTVDKDDIGGTDAALVEIQMVLETEYGVPVLES